MITICKLLVSDYPDSICSIAHCAQLRTSSSSSFKDCLRGSLDIPIFSLPKDLAALRRTLNDSSFNASIRYSDTFLFPTSPRASTTLSLTLEDLSFNAVVRSDIASEFPIPSR